MFVREKVIDILIDDDFADAVVNDDYSYLEQIIRGGFIGYDNMDDEELIQKMNNQAHQYQENHHQ